MITRRRSSSMTRQVVSVGNEEAARDDRTKSTTRRSTTCVSTTCAGCIRMMMFLCFAVVMLILFPICKGTEVTETITDNGIDYDDSDATSTTMGHQPFIVESTNRKCSAATVDKGVQRGRYCNNTSIDNSETTTRTTPTSTDTTVDVCDDSASHSDNIPVWAIWIIHTVQAITNPNVWSTLIIPIYIVCVALYLCIVYFRHALYFTFRIPFLPSFVIEACLVEQHHQKQEQQSTSKVPIQAVTTTDDAHHRTSSSQQQPTVDEQQPINISGSYKLVSSTNVDAFLAAQGVPWALRRLATAAVPIHHLIHVGHTLTIKIEAPGSGFVSQTNYIIGGPIVETNIRGRIFRDFVQYYVNPESNCVEGIVTEKQAVMEGYVVKVIRRFSSDMSRIDLSSTVSFPNDANTPDVVSSQVFERIAS